MQSVVSPTQQPARLYPVQGADWIYVVLRWSFLLVVLGINTTQHDLGGLWTLPLSTNFGWAFWTFVFFATVATSALISPPLGRVVPLFYLGDLLGTTVLALTSTFNPDICQALFLMPLIAIAFRFKRRSILLFIILAVSLESALLLRNGLYTVTDYLPRITTLIGVPLFVSFLSEQWSIDNRASVGRAEQRSAEALRQAEHLSRSRARAVMKLRMH